MTIPSTPEHLSRHSASSFAAAGTAMATAGFVAGEIASVLEVSLGVLVAVVALDQRLPAHPLLVGKLACAAAARTILGATLAYMAVAAVDLASQGADIKALAPLVVAIPAVALASELVHRHCMPSRGKRRAAAGARSLVGRRAVNLQPKRSGSGAVVCLASRRPAADSTGPGGWPGSGLRPAPQQIWSRPPSSPK